ncbi:hypothetical protein RRG08_060682 [Elysia crispata]|uniref:Uncharacterized protein n=1 Tax=Elysia crispata TaxID=231223 RepID=A0AAE0YRY3_9GAST|nr:hypothetical protein RRG08_060682 [Elysia crispata]
MAGKQVIRLKLRRLSVQISRAESVAEMASSGEPTLSGLGARKSPKQLVIEVSQRFSEVLTDHSDIGWLNAAIRRMGFKWFMDLASSGVYKTVLWDSIRRRKRNANKRPQYNHPLLPRSPPTPCWTEMLNPSGSDWRDPTPKLFALPKMVTALRPSGGQTASGRRQMGATRHGYRVMRPELVQGLFLQITENKGKKIGQRKFTDN